MNEETMDALERLLDTALGEYSNPEPLVGLERRILTNVRAADSRPRVWRGWALAAFAAALAVAVGLAVLVMPRPEALPAPRTASTLPRVAQPAPVWQPVRPVAVHQGIRRAVRLRIERPAPLSQQERALLALVAQAPDQTRDAFLDLQKKNNQPISVEAIQIEPLRSFDHYAQ